ncbi:hypothetical protein [Mucilaginibacter polytrichastri]|uniref:hypothetical protein n=1 Tax=Mucilaginibacter polytrichastri TaxID=1302689 RepID=UPI0011144475|nr:hypothetical protein [Mucilaginibacter polytrichastri]
MKEELFEIIILELDYFLIEKVREMRIRHQPYLSMLKLSQEMELGESYVSSVENLKSRVKYNIRAIHRVAKCFKLQSYLELFPSEVMKNDIVRMRLRKFPIKKGKLGVNDDGTVDKAYEIVSVNPLTEKELQLWKSNKLPYLTIIK